MTDWNSILRRLSGLLRSFARLAPRVTLAIAMTSCSLTGLRKDPLPLVETFELGGTSFSEKLLKHQAISIDRGSGVDGSDAIRVSYQGYPQGSRRILVSYPFSKGTLEATLSYDVKFCESFRFVKGGKLHGLGPSKLAAGGLPFGAEQWSARVAFLEGGKLGTYLYHQDLPGNYGETVPAVNFKFETNRYYSISLYVHLNNPPEVSNGRVELFVDGTKVVSRQNIRFRTADGRATLIRNLLFNTFHGGNTVDYAPRNSDGTFSQECAYFDNLAVYPYLKTVPTGWPN
jgi:hypothetical protein